MIMIIIAEMTIDHLMVCLANDKQLETSTSCTRLLHRKFTSCIIIEWSRTMVSKVPLKWFLSFLQQPLCDVPHLNFCVTKVVIATLNGTYAIYGPIFFKILSQQRHLAIKARFFNFWSCLQLFIKTYLSKSEKNKINRKLISECCNCIIQCELQSMFVVQHDTSAK